ncbi:MAG: methionyl-tRNA formyltransferase, partial [Gallionella sp.]|nr:methionyl-tRNA formyltransferase [Gallionella sp.]
HADFNGVSLKIWLAELLEGMQGEPGKVLAADKHGITVACGKGALRLEVLQRPGGKAQPAAQFLQAVPVKAGDKFLTS